MIKIFIPVSNSINGLAIGFKRQRFTCPLSNGFSTLILIYTLAKILNSTAKVVDPLLNVYSVSLFLLKQYCLYLKIDRKVLFIFSKIIDNNIL